jgi:hypothetical protein
MRRLVLVSLTALPLLAACKNESAQPVSSQPTETKPSAAAPSQPAPAAPTPSTVASAVGAPPACKVVSQKSWGKGINKETGLTVQEVDGRAAIGLAIGMTPHVLSIGKGGEGKLIKVNVKAGSELAKAPAAAEGTRHLMRVTPTKISGETAEAFVDYHDEYKSKRRRVACGPADSSEAWISFDDTPFFERDEKDRPTGDALKTLFSKKKENDADEGYHELRDCRTFADLKKGTTWIVGSDLIGTLKPDGTPSWRASLVVDKGAKVHELHTHDIPLGNDAAAKTSKFDIPVSHPLHDGSYVLAARYGGSMVAAILGPEKTLHGNVHSYPGMPTLPDIASDGDDTVLVTSFVKNKTEFLLKGLRLASQKPELPKQMVPIMLAPDEKDSETDPDFTRDSKGRRWVSHVDGERGHGKLFIAPVNADFTATGKPFEVTQEGEKAAEARMVPLADGTILVTFLRETDAGKGYELVTEDLDCSVVNLGLRKQATGDRQPPTGNGTGRRKQPGRRVADEKA